MKRIVSIGIIVLLCLLVLMTGDNARGDNLAGDLDQLPEHEEMLDLSNGEYDHAVNSNIYVKNGTYVYGLITEPTHPNFLPPENLFNGLHSSAYSVGKSLLIQFSTPIKITRIRCYPMGNEGVKGSDLEIKIPILHDKMYNQNLSDLSSVSDKTDYVEFIYDSLITTDLYILWGGDEATFNEIEFYYDRYYNPYHYTSEVNYNYTNITNEYINETNITYQNDTYQNITYENTIYQNDTYVNQTNETGVTYENITHEHYNTTHSNNTIYSNDTTIYDNQRLEDKIDGVWEQVNQTESKEIEKESKSLADKTYTDPILIVLLLAILIFQILLFVQRKRKQGELSEGKDAIEPEVEHTPSPGFSKETEIDLITRKVHQERSTDINPPPTQYTQYQHRPPQPQQPPVQAPPPDMNVSLPPLQSPPVPEDQEQKALPEHQFTPKK